jgi:glycosyltransferase involved in cell wall biosynthesis
MKVLLTQKVAGIAGSENYLLNILPALNQRGIQAEFLLLYSLGDEKENELFESKLTNLGIVCHKIVVGKFPSLSALWKIAKLIKKEKYDLVQSNLIYTDFALGLAKGLFHRKMKLIYGKHGYDDFYTYKFGFDPSFKRLDKFFLVSWFANLFANYVFTITKGLYELYTGLGISQKENTRIIHYGFEFKEDDFQSKPAYRFGNPQLILVGRLVNFKGHRYAIEALHILKKEYPDISLVLVGWGALEDEIRTQVKKLDLENNVIFTGRQYNARDYIASSDIFVLPSISEGFGIVVLEATSVKRPIVAFDVYSPKEIYENGKEILLAKPYDVNEFANCVKRLLIDKELYDNIVKNSYHKLMNYYTIDRMCDETIQLYNDVLKG